MTSRYQEKTSTSLLLMKTRNVPSHPDIMLYLQSAHWETWRSWRLPWHEGLQSAAGRPWFVSVSSTQQGSDSVCSSGRSYEWWGPECSEGWSAGRGSWSTRGWAILICLSVFSTHFAKGFIPLKICRISSRYKQQLWWILLGFHASKWTEKDSVFRNWGLRKILKTISHFLLFTLFHYLIFT